jgi:hypothetical protein
MEKEMKELYDEGLATHTAPESCAGPRKGAGEALTGAHAGRAIEPRKHQVLGADAVTASGRQYDLEQHCEHEIDLARSKNSEGVRSDGDACVETPCARTGRSLVLPSLMVATGRDGKAKAETRR